MWRPDSGVCCRLCCVVLSDGLHDAAHSWQLPQCVLVVSGGLSLSQQSLCSALAGPSKRCSQRHNGRHATDQLWWQVVRLLLHVGDRVSSLSAVELCPTGTDRVEAHSCSLDKHCHKAEAPNHHKAFYMTCRQTFLGSIKAHPIPEQHVKPTPTQFKCADNRLQDTPHSE